MTAPQGGYMAFRYLRWQRALYFASGFAGGALAAVVILKAWGL